MQQPHLLTGDEIATILGNGETRPGPPVDDLRGGTRPHRPPAPSGTTYIRPPNSPHNRGIYCVSWLSSPMLRLQSCNPIR